MLSSKQFHPALWWSVTTITLPFVVAGLLMAGLWFSILHQYRKGEVRTQYEAEVTVANLARAFEEHVRRTVQHLDGQLLYLRNEYQRNPGYQFSQSSGLLRKIYGSAFIQISIIDGKGDLLYSGFGNGSGPINLSDRDHFRIHRDDPEDKLFISRPVFGRVSHKWSIQLTRRISGPNGRFDGVIVVSVSPDYFSNFYETINVGSAGAITLVGTDGVIRARASKIRPLGDPIGAVLPRDWPFFDPDQPDVGIYRTRSTIDGVARIAAYRRVPEFPLVVLVLLAEDEVFDAVGRRFTASSTVGGLVSFILLTCALGMAFLLERERHYRGALEKANCELLVLAETDPLTGAKNRRAFSAIAEVELARHQRHGRPLTLVMMDLDHFKAVNDRFGHAAGDVVLVELIRRCREGLRSHDVIARLGGEEFVLLLPETSLNRAYQVAERIRRLIGGSPILTPAGLSIPITVSLGIAALGSNDQLEQLLRRADDALYQAKVQGRNRTVLAKGVSPPQLVPITGPI